MTGSITLQAAERKSLLDTYRTSHDPALRLRAHIILLLAAGYTWADIAAVLFCSTATIARWQQRFQRDRVPALLGEPRGRPATFAAFWVGVVCRWVTTWSPRWCGFFRSRWSCELLVLLLLEVYNLSVSRETVRRWLHQGQIVWRRPRPVVGPEDPERAAKLRALRRLLKELPENEIAVFQDEVDLNLNPDIGCMWMRRGEQATVVTPGTNEKRYLAGSISWRTGRVFLTLSVPKQGRTAALFVRHLDDLRRQLRRYRVIHVICDNARAHDCALVRQYLREHEGRIVLHYLPKYAPECNPIERIWWHLHEEVTRNHRCKSMPELVNLTFAWLEHRNPFPLEDSVYRPKKAG
jgi:putative transposase